VSAVALVASLSPTQMIIHDFGTASGGTMTTVTGSNVAADAWIYPDEPKALETLKKTSTIHAVKAEFLHINDDGSVEQINQSPEMPNGYSQTVVDTIKAHSNEQYITVSGALEGTTAAMEQSDATIDKMVALADKTGFGIELDWEDFGQWDESYYTHYKQFVQKLASRLHDHGHKLMIDGPPIYDEASQSWYQWRYEDLNPLVDDIVMMAYDNQFDTGVGNSIAPDDWTKQCLTWLKEKTDGKGIAGIAAYGYSGNKDNNRIAVNTSDIIKRRAGDLHFSRNSDGEMTAERDGTFYDYADKQTMAIRLKQVEASGLKRASVWSLGSNPWFNEDN